ncbi:hypothetical protein KY289_030050 [Solanum tuberosum]|nr:hypothetical protein KY289_030050 [Solanum tuberosum]
MALAPRLHIVPRRYLIGMITRPKIHCNAFIWEFILSLFNFHDIVMNVLPYNNMKHQNSVISVIHRVSHSTLFNEEWSITGIVGVAGCDLWQLWCCKYEKWCGVDIAAV